MHNAAFQAQGLEHRYLAMNVDKAHLFSELKRLAGENYLGVNITHPLKNEAFSVLQGKPKVRFSAAAANGRAVNVVAFRPDGMWDVDNTDGSGFVEAVREAWDFSPYQKHVAVLGCGGAGRAVLWACAQQQPRRVSIVSTAPEQARYAHDMISVVAPACPVDVLEYTDEATPGLVATADLVVQATPVFSRSILPSGSFRKGQYVVDMIYNPSRTPFMVSASAEGATVMNGLMMLLHQGVQSFQFWLGKPAPVEVMREALMTASKGLGVE